MDTDSKYQIALEKLKTHFGHTEFRSLQAQIITDLLAGEDLLVLMPTGGGKSICYQLPALIRPGTAIVISPLIALMEDQVNALNKQGIAAAFYNSSLNTEQAKQVLSALHQNKLELLYIAPERLLSQAFLERLQSCSIALFAIDEAHCISQWGHDFRPEYTQLHVLKQYFPDIPIIALTATADKQTRKDITTQLNFEPKQYVASFNRQNIYYEVQMKLKPFPQLLQFLTAHSGEAGIIYCQTRSTVERVTEKLIQSGFKAKAYHAGLSHHERRSTQALFQADEIHIIVATIAFGMGIDKPNIRFVLHFDLPKHIESYYQETGRAGRDGKPAHALLLYNPDDVQRLRARLHAQASETQQRIDQYKLNHMLAFVESHDCRRQVLLRYFDEESTPYCGYCDCCDHPPQQQHVTEDARKLLSCIYRLEQRYGMNHVIDVLKGSQSQRIMQARHHQLSTYGIGKHASTDFWKRLAWQLIHQGYCTQNPDRYYALNLTAKAVPLLQGKEEFYLPVRD